MTSRVVTAIGRRADELKEARVQRLVSELDDVVTTLETQVGEKGPWLLPMDRE
jgi:hypothetical protein